MRGANCSGTCATRDHLTYGECMRAKGIHLSPAVNDTYGTRQRAWDRELDHYESAVRQGLNPENHSKQAVDAAFRKAET